MPQRPQRPAAPAATTPIPIPRMFMIVSFSRCPSVESVGPGRRRQRNGSVTPQAAAGLQSATSDRLCREPDSRRERGTVARDVVLVVEDDLAVRRGLADALRWAGYEPLEAGDGALGQR